MNSSRDALFPKAFNVFSGKTYNQVCQEIHEKNEDRYSLFYEVVLPENRSWEYLRDNVYPTLARFLKNKSMDPESAKGVVISLFFMDRCYLIEELDFIKTFCGMEGLIVDVIKSRENMESLLKGIRCILAAKDPDVINDLATIEGCKDSIVRVPYMNLTRLSQIKVAAILALSNGLIRSDDRLVCLSGSRRHRILDNLTVMDVDREFEILSSKTLDIASQMVINPID